MTGLSTPPPFARWLLEHALPSDVRESVAGDLDEMFQSDCRTHGLRSARRRYWSQAMSFTMHFVVERWHDRRRGGSMRVGMSWLDFKLGLRMLSRYPMLTIVGGLAMAVAIGVGAGTFEVIKRVTDPSLPLLEGERIVGLNYWDRAESTLRPPTAYDFLSWREGLRTLEDIGAFRLVQRNLAVGEEVGEPVEAAEISAVGFRLIRVAPQLGRPLVEEDEAPQAPAVVVLGNRLWQTRFGGDPAVIGRIVRLGVARATVVGVMPEGFVFPVQHNIWTQLRAGELPREPGRGGVLRVFGRLATGVTLSESQAEVTTLAARAAAEFPQQYQHLRPQVLPYAESIMGIPRDFLVRAGIQSINLFAALFLVVVCGNVALLMFARAATREREILVRRALGADRGRIVMQLVAEAFVLGTIAATVGLTATNLGLKWALAALSTESEGWPFWLEGGLSSTTLTYAALLTVLAAVVAGAVPALKVTKTAVAARLREASAGAGGLRMGGIWTGVIVAQIAATVLFTAVAYVAERQAVGIASARAAFPAEEYLAVRLEMDREGLVEAATDSTDDGFLQHYTATIQELERRLVAEPRIAGVTVAERLPLMAQDGGMIELDEVGTTASSIRREYFVTTTGVDLDFFELFQTPVVSGRAFTLHDTGPTANTIVVNQLFVDEVLAGRNAIGRRIRYKPQNSQSTTEAAPWFEIVGVVRDLVPKPEAPLSLDNPAKPVVYHTLGSSRTERYPLHLAAHVRGDVRSLLPTLRLIGANVSPALRLNDFQRLDEGTSSDARAWDALADVILLVSAIALVLSLAAIYSVMSFTVSRRTREIAIRVALGAEAASILANVFRRPVAQVGAGVAVGCLLVGALVALSLRDTDVGVDTVARHTAMLLAYGMAMMGVCALACIGPVLRVFRVEPTDVLRDDE
jgi:putative ABC transport system permease protein